MSAHYDSSPIRRTPASVILSEIPGRHLHDPSQRHVDALKPIYRYLSSRVHDGPVYDQKGPLQSTCYTESDYAGCKDTRRSVSGNLLLANGQPIMWGASLHSFPGHSSTETEFISADTGARNLMCMSRLADEMHIPMQKQVANLIVDNKPSIRYHEGVILENDANDLHLLVDNKGAYDIANSYGPSKRTKHMEVRHHYSQYLINNKTIRITLVPTTEQWSDLLTKRVGKALFKSDMQNIGFPV